MSVSTFETSSCSYLTDSSHRLAKIMDYSQDGRRGLVRHRMSRGLALTSSTRHQIVSHAMWCWCATRMERKGPRCTQEDDQAVGRRLGRLPQAQRASGAWRVSRPFSFAHYFILPSRASRPVCNDLARWSECVVQSATALLFPAPEQNVRISSARAPSAAFSPHALLTSHAACQA